MVLTLTAIFECRYIGLATALQRRIDSIKTEYKFRNGDGLPTAIPTFLIVKVGGLDAAACQGRPTSNTNMVTNRKLSYLMFYKRYIGNFERFDYVLDTRRTNDINMTLTH
jgi:hypothetical protein